MLTTQKLRNYRTWLRTMQTRLMEHAAQLREETSNRIDRENGDGFSTAPVDLADRASQKTEVAVNMGIAENEAHLQTEIDAALERIDVGTYGICEECGAAIAGMRLNAVPYARFCIRCERRAEQHV